MELGDYQLLHPQFLALLALIPIGLWLAARRVPRGTLRFSTTAPFHRVRPSLRLRLRVLVPFLRIAALTFLIVALSRPQKGTELTPERSRGIGILLVIDKSGSMTTPDFEIDGKQVARIDAVKKVATEFIRGGGGLPGRPDDEIGIVAFSGYPVPSAPLTLDHGAVLEVLDSIEALDPRAAERDSRGRALYPDEYETAIGDAIALAADRLRDAAVKSKVMILLSDGEQTTGELSPLEGAKIAETFGIKVYTIGIGRSGVTLVTVNDPFFGPRKVRQRSDLDEATLERIAETTGGKYFNAATTGALTEVYAAIDRLERSEIETTRFYRWEERFLPLALAGLVCIVLEVILGQSIFRRIP